MKDSNDPVSDIVRSAGLRLLERGYDLTSIRSGLKHPGRKNWQQDRVGLRHDAWRETQGDPTSAQQVENWSRDSTIAGLGVFGRGVCGVDLDISDPIAVQHMIAFVERLCGSTVRRIGRAPRVLLVYKCEDTISHPPTTKRVDPDDLTADEQGVDFVSGEGRQFVAYGTHPDTKRPYTYDGPELADVDRANLPPITRDQCAAIASEFERLAAELGWQAVQRTAKVNDSPPPNRDPLDTFHVEPALDVDLDAVRAALDKLDPAAMPYQDWVCAIAAVHHQTDGSAEGLAIADAWSRNDGRYKDGDVKTRWRGFGKGAQRPITFATVLAWIRDGEYKAEAEDFGVVPDTAAGSPKPKSRAFTIEDESTFSADFSPPDWLVEGYLVRGEASALYGDPGTYKSFMAVDLAYHIASGREWHGSPVRQGAVVYVAGEGRHGLRARAAAWRRHHELAEDVPLGFTSGPINLSDRAALAAVIPTLDAYAARFGGLGLIVVDTLARNNTADENSNTDMSVVMTNAGDIQARYGSAVLILHHTGTQNKDRVRGASAIQGALDSSYRLDKQEPGLVKMVCTKMKDAAEPLDKWFRGEVYGVGEASSLVFTETAAREGEVAGNPAAGLRGLQAALYAIIAEEGDVSRESLRAIVLAEPVGVWHEGDTERKKQLRDALKALRGKGLINVPDDEAGRVTTTAYHDAVADFGDID